MIESVTGKVAAVEPAAVVVDLHGLGVRVEVTPSVAEGCGAPGSPVTLLTHLVLVQDQAPRLFGFPSGEARALFRLLLSVSGIGPSIALRVMAAGEPAQIAGAIARGDDAGVKVKGVGPKIAKRLVTELKDKVGGLAEAAAWTASSAHRRPVGDAAGVDRPVEEAFLALRSLELEPEEARRLLKDTRHTLPHATTEELVRAVLLKL